MLAQSIDCGYTLELPHGGSSNKSMFWIKNKKNRFTPANSLCIKVGSVGGIPFMNMFS